MDGWDLKQAQGDFWPETAAAAPSMPWIETRPGIPYFVTDRGEPWTPIGQNDAITWPELAGLFRRRDLPGVERHLRWLKAHGVTCPRMMLEYVQGEHRYLERPAGNFVPNMVQLWDDLFALCERVGMHLLITPYDTFFMWRRWREHPYSRGQGGPCASRRRWLSCAETRTAIKARLAFASDRWGASPALFAWDLWNEVRPSHAGGDPAAIMPFIDDVGPWLRAHELRRHGRAHLQTVSVFGPELAKHPALVEPVFRHPALDFVNLHLYEKGTIDDPRDTVAPARAVGRLVRAGIAEAVELRPLFDSEHGPIHRFKDKKRMLPAAFDDEYFRHIQWAHLASGGAGGGMRWPNRHPHALTPGMREAQRALAAFLPLIDWTTFRRRNLNEEIALTSPAIARFGCGDGAQAIAWLLRIDCIGRDRRLAAVPPLRVRIAVPGLNAGRYRATGFDTSLGTVLGELLVDVPAGAPLEMEVEVAADLALAIRRA